MSSELIAAAGEFSGKLDTPGAASSLKNLDAASGPFTDNYEKFVHKIFTPAEYSTRSAAAMAQYTDMASYLSPDNPLPDIPSSVLARMDKLESETDPDAPKVFSPLEMMYTYYNQCGMEDQPYAKFPVYQPKTSSEYHSIKNRKPRIGETPAVGYKVAKTTSTPNIWSPKPVYEEERHRISADSRRLIAPSNSQYMILDYKEGAPLSPYLYPQHNFVHREDSRIVGSDFVMLSLRPHDPWKNKVDKLLEEAKRC